jgi:hypothetical protein
MKRKFYFFLFLFTGMIVSAGAQSNWTGIHKPAQTPADVLLVNSNIQETQIQFALDGYMESAINTPRGKEMQITIGNGTLINETGHPDLSKLVTTIIIPDVDEMEVNVISADYVEFKDMDIAPSKGHFTRDIRPDDVPFVYGEAYNEDAFWPGKLAQLEEPFIMRDFRGQTVTVFPFQYNPVTRTLRVYTDMLIEVTSTGKEGADPLYRTRDVITLEPEYNAIYNRFFLNMNAAEKSYPMLEGEEGSLLIIAYDSFMDAMQPFVDWKRKLGRKTEIVPTSVAGSSATAIKSYVQNYYNDNDDFAYLLLVGDGPQIPPMNASGGQSDNAYGFLVGSNSYNDIFVGRFSAENVAHVETQIQRMIEYERDLDETDTWLNTGMGIARNEGAGGGHFGEADYVHMDLLRDTLLNFTYETVHRNYDGNVPGIPNTTAAQISNNLNNGVSTINFCNHGSVTGWSVAGYNISHVNQLTNVGKLPYIQAVACVNGAFVSNFCFAEAWLRATHDGEPTGAIGMMASTINQAWQPPMTGQDEMASIKTEASIPYGPTIKRTYAGVSINGSMYMIPQHGNSGISTHQTWVLFGDPTLMVRTDTPQTLNPIYNPVVFLGTDFFDITIPDADGAVVAISYYDEIEEEVVILGTATVDGGTATVIFEEPTAEPGMLTLVVSGFNKTTYINEELQVIPPEGPYVIFDEFVIDDSEGNNNNQADYGEFIKLDMSLKNVGIELAEGVQATLTTENEHVSIVENHSEWGNIDDDGNMMVGNAFSFEVNEVIPDNHNVLFTLDITDTEGHEWSSNFSLRIYSPQFSIGEFYVDDSAHGDGNGRLDPGETADIMITYTNEGGAPAMAPISEFFAANSYLTLHDLIIEHDIVPAGESIEVAYAVTAHEAALEGTFVDLHFSIEDAHSFTSEQLLVIGQTPEMVLGDGNSPSNQYPFYNYYKANRSQMLYLSSELGAGEKTITEIAFEIIQAANNYNDLPNFVVRMMHTSTDAFSGSFLNTNSASEVYTASEHTIPMQTGWHTIELDEYFEYNGTDNLLVEIVWGLLPNWTSTYFRVASTSVSGNRVAYGYNDSNAVPSYNGASNIRPNLWLTFAAEEPADAQTVEFHVRDTGNNPLPNAGVMVGSMTHNTDSDGMASFDLLPGNYGFVTSLEGYLPYENDFTITGQDILIEVILHAEDEDYMAGDANCDGAVNVLDVITINQYYLELDPQPFCFANADINQDGLINVLDIVGTVNIFSRGSAKPFIRTRSANAHLYLDSEGISLESDGSITGLQFELTNDLIESMKLIPEVGTHEFSVKSNGKTMSVMVFSIDNTPFPSGKINLASFDERLDNTEWGQGFAANINASEVPVVMHYDVPTDAPNVSFADDINFNTFPNPAQDILYVEFMNESPKATTVKLLNIHGQLIDEQVVTGQGHTRLSFRTDGLQSGFYMLKLDYNDDQIIEKIMVK